MHIRTGKDADRAGLADLCIEAFTPIHDGFRATLGQALFDLAYADWQDGYRRTLAQADLDTDAAVLLVAEDARRLLGFALVTADAATRQGEIGLLAVAPAAQRLGAGRALIDAALDWMRRKGMTNAYAGTGGDAAHAAARAAYRAAGFSGEIPGVHFLRPL